MNPTNRGMEAEETVLSDLFPRNVQDNIPLPDGAECVKLLEEGRYAAYAYDLGYMWRWVITRDGEEVQDGPALSLEASRQCATSVMAFFRQRDNNRLGT